MQLTAEDLRDDLNAVADSLNLDDASSDRKEVLGYQNYKNMLNLEPRPKVKVVNLYSASSCIHTSNALFVTNQSRRVQPANTGWRTGRPGSPVSCTNVPTFRNLYNGLLLI